MWIRFQDSAKDGAGIFVYFTTQPTYRVGWCTENVQFTMSGTEKYRIWTFKKESSILKLFCNRVEIFNFNFVESSLNEDRCKDTWSLALTQLRFQSNSNVADVASDYFRPYRRGIKYCDYVFVLWRSI